MLTEAEVWVLVEGRCNKAEIAAACECDESVARALMIQAAMSRGFSERQPRRILNLAREAVVLSGALPAFQP